MARYGIVVFWPDQPTADEQILLHVVGMPVNFPRYLLESKAVLDTPAETFTTYSIRLNGVEKATVTFPEGGAIGGFACSQDWFAAPGDRIEIIAPTAVDPMAAGIAITLMGEPLEMIFLTASLSVKAGYAKVAATMDHIRLFAHLENEADIVSGKLTIGNKFPNTILRADANIVTAYLTDSPSFKCSIGPDGGSELISFLTVVHDQTLFR